MKKSWSHPRSPPTTRAACCSQSFASSPNIASNAGFRHSMPPCSLMMAIGVVSFSAMTKLCVLGITAP
jgi:hypothetical protein